VIKIKSKNPEKKIPETYGKMKTSSISYIKKKTQISKN
jgi:hypothetical protein